MKRFFATLATIMVLLTTTAGCLDGQSRVNVSASRNYVTKQLTGFGEFDAIKITGSPNVEYRQSHNGTTSVSIYGSDNVIEYLEVENHGGTMTVKFRNNTNITGNHKIKVIASSPSFRSGSITGSGDLELKGEVIGSKMRFEVTGSGDVNCDNIVCDDVNINVTGSGDVDINHVATETLSASVTGSGDIELSGKATRVAYSVTGSGDISASGLRADIVEASVSGSGDISCFAEVRLDAKVTGSGDIVYKGDPDVVNVHGKKGSVTRR